MGWITRQRNNGKQIYGYTGDFANFIEKYNTNQIERWTELERGLQDAGVEEKEREGGREQGNKSELSSWDIDG